MICPQCEVEYRTGFTQCADCDIPLVDRLEPARSLRGGVGEPGGLPAGLGGPDSTALILLWETASSDELGDLLEVLEDGEIPYAVLAGTALRGLDGQPVHRHDAPDPWHARILVPGSRWEEAAALRPPPAAR